MAEMTENQITDVIQTWIQQYEEIRKLKNIKYVQIFENKGNMMGASNPHPHGQIWADSTIPTIVQREQEYQQRYFKIHNAPLLTVYAKQELGNPVRILTQNPAFLSCVPFWATWPYETMIIPNKHIRSLSDMTVNDTQLLANTLKRLTSAYDRVFDAPFPYSMGIHQAPATGKPHDEWQMHFHFYPPLLRSATVKKFLVGYEMLAQAQRDITPENAANTLRGYIR
jgi:UDPglucose--hexose-1-phosphate uridylyltransferase